LAVRSAILATARLLVLWNWCNPEACFMSSIDCMFEGNIQSMYWLATGLLQCTSHVEPQEQVGNHSSTCQQQVRLPVLTNRLLLLTGRRISCISGDDI